MYVPAVQAEAGLGHATRTIREMSGWDSRDNSIQLQHGGCYMYGSTLHALGNYMYRDSYEKEFLVEPSYRYCCHQRRNYEEEVPPMREGLQGAS